MTKEELDKQARGDDSDMMPMNQGFCYECDYAYYYGAYTGFCPMKWDTIERNDTCSSFEEYVWED